MLHVSHFNIARPRVFVLFCRSLSFRFRSCLFYYKPSPQLGYTATYIIGTLSLPGFIFLFYAAIKKGKAEVEEDDAKFGKGRW